MKTRTLLLTVFICFILGGVSSQEKDIEANSDIILNDTSKIATLLNSKTFEFVANTVYPTNGSPKNLVGNGYSVTFSPEMIISNLPFYGRAYSGIAMGKDKGMRFQGKPESFNIEKKNDYQVNATVNDGDSYKLFLSVSDSGYATLTISSSDRGTISYQGEFVKVQ